MPCFQKTYHIKMNYYVNFDKRFGTHGNQKKILGATLKLSAKQHSQIQPIWPIFPVNGLYWQCCLAGSSKTAHRISTFFSFDMGAGHSVEVKNIDIYVPAFFKHNNTSFATLKSSLPIICL